MQQQLFVSANKSGYWDFVLFDIERKDLAYLIQKANGDVFFCAANMRDITL